MISNTQMASRSEATPSIESVMDVPTVSETGDNLPTTTETDDPSVSPRDTPSRQLIFEPHAPTKSIFASNITTFIVGPQLHRLKAHKDVLMQADFFAGLFRGSWSEAQKDEIELPEDDTLAVGTMLHYLYTGKLVQ